MCADGEDEEDEGSEDDSNDGSDDGSDEEDSDEEDSDEEEEEEEEDAGTIPTLEEVAALYKGPQRWRYLADPAFYVLHCEQTGASSLRTEPNFGTKYWYDVLPGDLLEAWDMWKEVSSRIAGEESEIDSKDDEAAVRDLPSTVNLSLPARNPYIPAAETMAPAAEKEGDTIITVELPVEVSKPGLNARLNAFRYMDKSNQWVVIPKVVVAMKFSSSIVAQNIHFHVANDLLGLILPDALNEVIYMVMMAGIVCEIESDDYGFSLVVSGFKDKILVVVKDILSTIFDKDFEFISPERFKMQSEVLLRRYNCEAIKAGSAASQARKMGLLPSQYSGKDCEAILAAYATASAEAHGKLLQFMGLFLRSCVADVLIHGSYGEIDADALINSVSGSLDEWPATPATTAESIEVERGVVPVSQLPAQSMHVLRTTARSQTEQSICVELYFQAGSSDVRTISFLDMLEQILSEPFFNDLRTKQQVRYLYNL